jgi:hypothetical protein
MLLQELEKLGCGINLQTPIAGAQELTEDYAISFKSLCAANGVHSASTVHFLMNLDGEILFAGGYRELFELGTDGEVTATDFVGMVRRGTDLVRNVDRVEWFEHLPSSYGDADVAYLAAAPVVEGRATRNLPIVDGQPPAPEATVSADACESCLGEAATAFARPYNSCKEGAQKAVQWDLLGCEWRKETLEGEEQKEAEQDCAQLNLKLESLLLDCGVAPDPHSPAGLNSASIYCQDEGACWPAWCEVGTSSCDDAFVPVFNDDRQKIGEKAAPHCVLSPHRTEYNCCVKKEPNGFKATEDSECRW